MDVVFEIDCTRVSDSRANSDWQSAIGTWPTMRLPIADFLMLPDDDDSRLALRTGLAAISRGQSQIAALNLARYAAPQIVLPDSSRALLAAACLISGSEISSRSMRSRSS